MGVEHKKPRTYRLLSTRKNSGSGSDRVGHVCYTLFDIVSAEAAAPGSALDYFSSCP